MKSTSAPGRMCLGVLSSLLVFSVLGCAGPELRPSGEPGWVRQGTGAFLDRNQKSFYGVGVVSKGNDPSFSRASADQQARAKIAKMFEFYTESLMRDYSPSTRTLSPETLKDAQEVEALIKTFSATSLSAVVIIDHWFDPRGGIYYSLARLNLGHFQEQVRQAKKLNASVKGFVNKNAQKAFNALGQEEAKRR